MKKIEITCDGCGKKLADEAYILSHESISGRPIIGDNRISQEKYFCRDCFGKSYEFIQSLSLPK